MVIGALLSVVGVGAVPAFVAILAFPDKVLTYPVAGDFLMGLGIDTGLELVYFGCGLLAVVFLLKNAYLTLMFYFQFRVVERQRVRMGDRLFSTYMRAPYVFHLQRNSAELLRNVHTETVEIIVGVIMPLLEILMGAILTLFILAFLIITTPWVALLGIAFLGLGSVLLFRAVRHRLTAYGQAAKAEREGMVRAIQQGLGALVDARISGKEHFLIRAYHQSVAHFSYLDRQRNVIKNANPLILEILAVFGLLIIIIALVIQGMSLESLIPTLALYGAAIIRLRRSIAMVVGGLSQIQYSAPSIDSIMDDLQQLDGLSQEVDLSEPDTASGHRMPFRGEIVLDQVAYTYPDAGAPALQQISLRIRQGETVAFVGATGSGKTTLVRLILGLLSPSSGKIVVDGKDMHDDLPGWLNNVGYIPQFIYLLDDTIEQNVAFGEAPADRDQEALWEALRVAQLDGFVRSLPQGIHTRVGENGVRLSGGQRQRIGLARALYRKPEVLVMDEATSALDNQTEYHLMEAVEALQGERTQIIIAHRLSTVKKCDRLYFLEHGRIRSSGAYEEIAQQHASFF